MSQLTVLFVHQSSEMYGSDKVLLYLVLGLSKFGIKPIVLLPSDGPLLIALQDEGIETHIVPVTKLDRATLSVNGLLALPFALLKSVRAIDRVLSHRRIDVVYSNTLAVLSSAVWSRINRVPHLWHVHELLMSPSVVRRGFPWLLRMLADKVVCNSKMTKEWVLNEQPLLECRTVMIWNGLGPRPASKPDIVKNIRANLSISENQLLVVLVGRINRWKGQALLIEAATILWNRGYCDVHYLIVGGAPKGMEHLLEHLLHKISASAVSSNIHVMPFTDDIWSIWDSCNIAVVPSIEPEPFGMVAIEAMASKVPVVAAAHGGLLDIVDHGNTGFLFKPGNSDLLADEIEKLLVSESLRVSLGLAGLNRQLDMFSLDVQVTQVANVIIEMAGVKNEYTSS